jgi:hypothetical protein
MTGSTGVAPTIAAGIVSADGVFADPRQGFVGTIVHVPNSGVYNLGPVSTSFDFAVLVSLVNQAGAISWATGGMSGLDIIVQTYDSAGTPADRSFSIAVFDLG